MTRHRRPTTQGITLAGRSQLSRTLGANDPRIRRNAQAMQAADQIIGDGLSVDNDGRMTVRVKEPLIVDSDGEIGLIPASNDMGPPARRDDPAAEQTAESVEAFFTDGTDPDPILAPDVSGDTFADVFAARLFEVKPIGEPTSMDVRDALLLMDFPHPVAAVGPNEPTTASQNDVLVVAQLLASGVIPDLEGLAEEVTNLRTQLYTLADGLRRRGYLK